ncbi:MAG: UDP-N-acetylmuramoyl-tripeptide--D-alanyl-D-alanine ligase [candidate division KSB1 bacterium]|nr:UDP-N-acetylmuramoyl-tripeptide--D-alanyl-D-alanine ligase [candidate division KSB1 bacterium]MDZ7301564.1 UDP-N-acetylmuramoyl-tripeptide--D-alanyl-D-alanine ligase [candidate division KSB1 bacterium]MDZ7311020.1 UDP-N-acetylmuramoyl-tripeptide--D-alanyl-D-alanine ligase [candidate division KSB1 bacterium]
MPLILTLGELQRACGANSRYVGESVKLTQRPAGLSTDSRTCKSGEVFVALRGEKFDGHRFVAQVLAAGALAAVVEASWVESHHHTKQKVTGDLIIVEDTLRALQDIGHLIRRRWGKPILAITGSNGKTTAKELVTAVLSQSKLVHKTTGNLNNHIGVPLTLAELNYGHDLAVVEMGTNHFGEIARLCEIADPNFGLITNIGHAHLEFFKDLEGVARAKRELFVYVHDHNGIVFLNADDPKLRASLPSGTKAITFGITQPAQVQGKIVTVDENGCVTLAWRDQHIHLAIPGRHNALHALAAIAVGEHFGMAPEKIRHAVEHTPPVSKRMQVLQRGEVTIINDAYNANPDSMRAALEFLATMPIPPHGRRVAVLGDMLELGELAPAEHEEIGRLITKLPVHAVFAYGPQMKHLVQAIGETLWAEHFDDKLHLCQEVKRSVRSGDVILVKGSRGMAMEEVIEKLPENEFSGSELKTS